MKPSCGGQIVQQGPGLPSRDQTLGLYPDECKAKSEFILLLAAWKEGSVSKAMPSLDEESIRVLYKTIQLFTEDVAPS